ncbi:MAG: hypothetical protein ACK5O7_07070 [Holosporales bacterium]
MLKKVQRNVLCGVVSLLSATSSYATEASPIELPDDLHVLIANRLSDDPVGLMRFLLTNRQLGEVLRHRQQIIQIDEKFNTRGAGDYERRENRIFKENYTLANFLRRFPNLTSLDIERYHRSPLVKQLPARQFNGTFVALERLTKLRTLRWSFPHDVDLAHRFFDAISVLTQLKKLEFFDGLHTQSTPGRFGAQCALTLQKLNLEELVITSPDLLHASFMDALPSLSQLKSLKMDVYNVKNLDFLDQPLNKMPGLECLSIRLGFAHSIHALAKPHFPSLLKDLSLSETTDEDILSISRCTNLRTLNVSRNNETQQLKDADIKSLTAHLSRLQQLDVKAHLTVAGIEDLARHCPDLRYLRYEGSVIDAQMVEAFTKFRFLNHVNVAGSHISPDEIKTLVLSLNLQRLNVPGHVVLFLGWLKRDLQQGENGVLDTPLARLIVNRDCHWDQRFFSKYHQNLKLQKYGKRPITEGRLIEHSIYGPWSPTDWHMDPIIGGAPVRQEEDGVVFWEFRLKPLDKIVEIEEER